MKDPFAQPNHKVWSLDKKSLKSKPKGIQGSLPRDKSFHQDMKLGNFEERVLKSRRSYSSSVISSNRALDAQTSRSGEAAVNVWPVQPETSYPNFSNQGDRRLMRYKNLEKLLKPVKLDKLEKPIIERPFLERLISEKPVLEKSPLRGSPMMPVILLDIFHIYVYRRQTQQHTKNGINFPLS